MGTNSLAAGPELSAACDRLPGQAPPIPHLGWVGNRNPDGEAGVKPLTQALVAGLGDHGYIPGQNLQMESRFPTR